MDGQRVLLGQDVVGFSLSVESVNPAESTETLLVQHVPPPMLHVEQPAKWMQEPTSARPNNFVQVSDEGDGFIAETGKESFDVRLVLILAMAAYSRRRYTILSRLKLAPVRIGNSRIAGQKRQKPSVERSP